MQPYEPDGPNNANFTPPRPQYVPARPARPTPFVTYGLLAANIGVFVLMLVSGVSFTNLDQMIAWGANYAPLTVHGQWWRLFTACFLHFGIVHIGFNMYVLWQIGLFTEPLFGGLLFLLLYLAAGIGGNVIGTFLHPNVVSAGASGAIFGIYGGLLAFLLLNRKTLVAGAAKAVSRSVFVFLAYNLFFGLADRQTDLTAHIGGLVIGFLAGLVLTPLSPALRRRRA